MTSSATFRWLNEGHVDSAVPVFVVEQTPNRIVLFQPSGTIGMKATGSRGGPNNRNMLPGGYDGGFEESIWTGDGVLRVHQAGDEWSTWRWLDEEGSWSSYYYVNLEAPWDPTSIGFDSADWILDLIVLADGSWNYKDEDELQWAEASGLYDSPHVERVRAAGRDAISAVESARWPFDADWDSWLPPNGRPAPTLDEAWNNR